MNRPISNRMVGCILLLLTLGIWSMINWFPTQNNAQDNPEDDQPVMYSKARGDRSGAAIHDMLFAHAYAYHHNLTYGGACHLRKEARELLRRLDLATVFPIACPRHRDQIVRDEKYRTEAIFTESYRQFLKRQLPNSLTHHQPQPESTGRVAVHIRRGDVRICYKHEPDRYLPNQHYLDLIDQYTQSDRMYKVTIFSNSNSSSSFRVFAERNYTLALDTDLASVWGHMIQADVIIMSKSSFSYVPSILNTHGRIVYTPFWHEPLSGWDVVNETQMQQTMQSLQVLRTELCPRESSVS